MIPGTKKKCMCISRVHACDHLGQKSKDGLQGENKLERQRRRLLLLLPDASLSPDRPEVEALAVEKTCLTTESKSDKVEGKKRSSESAFSFEATNDLRERNDSPES